MKVMEMTRTPDTPGVGGGEWHDTDVAAAAGTLMTEPRTNNVKIISERISSAHYHVDSSAVAAAIVERLLAGNLIPNELRR